MPSRSRLLMLALVLVLALVAGCSGADEPRNPGDPVSEDEAQVLAELLHENFEEGGADFVVSAPYGEGALLTITGEIDFRRSVGRAQAVTTFEEEGREDEVRTVFFTPKDIWFGDVPGLAEALADADAPDADYMRRPLITTAAGGTASLVDVLVQLVLNLAARAPDDPRAFQDGSYTWQGQGRVDGQLAALFRLRGGQTVAVDPTNRTLVQYVTPLQGQDFEVTITLADHGEREIDLPADEEAVLAEDYPEVAASVGV